MEFTLYEKLKEAYETSTHSNNRFKTAINSIRWDNIFNADGETCFCLKGFSLMVENLDPFNEAWRPSVFFSDGTFLEFRC